MSGSFNFNHLPSSPTAGLLQGPGIGSGSPSPWNTSSPSGSGYDSLTLPPINPDANYDQLPSLDNPQYFDALPLPLSPSPFHHPTESQSSISFSRRLPPTSTQPARRPRPSEYRLEESESPDPFQDFLDLTPSHSPMPEMAPRTRRNSTPSSVVDLTESSPQVGTKKRKVGDAGTGRASKARKTSGNLASSLVPTSEQQQSLEAIEMVDLERVETDQNYEDLKARQQAEAIKVQNEEEANRPTKLAEFQCIICMDNPTDLMVTHCGHLFCSECLHSALHAGDKKNCPVCRTTISIGKPGHKQPRNGIFALEMKLMTANKKGKQPVKAQ